MIENPPQSSDDDEDVTVVRKNSGGTRAKPDRVIRRRRKHKKRKKDVKPLDPGQIETTTPPITPPVTQKPVPRVTDPLEGFPGYDGPGKPYPYTWLAMGEGVRPNVFIPKEFEVKFASNSCVYVNTSNNGGKLIIETVSNNAIIRPSVSSRKFVINNSTIQSSIQEL
jgi:hypothetical protein